MRATTAPRGTKKNLIAKPLVVIREALRAEAIPANIPASQRFFKTGAGEYAEGDQFLGVRVPATRKLVPTSDGLDEKDVLELLHSDWHEERMLALLILVRRYHRGAESERKLLVSLYLGNTRWINNWDLVDTSAPGILGRWVADHPKEQTMLRKLARSSDLWERRIAVLATLELIRRKEYAPTLELVEMLLADDHDLIQKACGWMLREIGEKDTQPLMDFLHKHAAMMPRTMLRYAIEKCPPEERRYWMSLRKS